MFINGRIDTLEQLFRNELIRNDNGLKIENLAILSLLPGLENKDLPKLSTLDESKRLPTRIKINPITSMQLSEVTDSGILQISDEQYQWKSYGKSKNIFDTLSGRKCYGKKIVE